VGCPVNAAGRRATAQVAGVRGTAPFRMVLVGARDCKGGFKGVPPLPPRQAFPPRAPTQRDLPPPFGGKGGRQATGGLGGLPLYRMAGCALVAGVRLRVWGRSDRGRLTGRVDDARPAKGQRNLDRVPHPRTASGNAGAGAPGLRPLAPWAGRIRGRSLAGRGNARRQVPPLPEFVRVREPNVGNACPPAGGWGAAKPSSDWS